jgi:phosphotransferase system HPr (HPr) family protein
MPEINLTVTHDVGLHAQPAALFVQTSKQFECDITVVHGEGEGNAKSILGLLALGVERGATITVRAEGEGAEQALAELKELVESDFGEAK